MRLRAQGSAPNLAPFYPHILLSAASSAIEGRCFRDLGRSLPWALTPLAECCFGSTPSYAVPFMLGALEGTACSEEPYWAATAPLSLLPPPACAEF